MITLLLISLVIVRGESFDAGEVENKIVALLQLEDQASWSFQNAKRQVVNLLDLLKIENKEIFFQAPLVEKSEGPGIAAHLKIVENSNPEKNGDEQENDLAIAVAIYDREFKTLLTTRLIRFDFQRPAIDTLAKIEQTIITVKYELMAKSSMVRSLANSVVSSVASSARPEQHTERHLRIIFWGGVGMLAIPLIARFGNKIKNTKQGKVMVAIWIGALAIAGLSLAIDQLTNFAKEAR